MSSEAPDAEATRIANDPPLEEPTPARAFFLLALLIAAGGFLVYRAYPAHHPQKPNPGFLDNVFANNLVLFAARLVLFSAALVLAVTAVYVIYSMARGMRAGLLLSKFGPFEMQAVQDLSADVESWQSLWTEAMEENEELRTRLEETDALLGQLSQAYEEATTGAPAEGDVPEPPTT